MVSQQLIEILERNLNIYKSEELLDVIGRLNDINTKKIVDSFVAHERGPKNNMFVSREMVTNFCLDILNATQHFCNEKVEQGMETDGTGTVNSDAEKVC